LAPFSLLMVPFVAFAVFLGYRTLRALFGHTRFTVDGDAARVFTGLGRIGRTRRFRWDQIDSVREEFTPGTKKGGLPTISIVLEGTRRIRLDAPLHDERRYFLLKAIEAMVAQRPSRALRAGSP